MLHKFWWIYWKFERHLFAKVFFAYTRIFTSIAFIMMAINFVFASSCLLRIWEYGKKTLLTSVTHTLVYVRGSSVQLSEHSASANFIHLLLERATQSCVSCFLHFTKLISRDFWFWWFNNYLCCRISVCLLCSFDGIFEVTVCKQVNS